MDLTVSAHLLVPLTFTYNNMSAEEQHLTALFRKSAVAQNNILGETPRWGKVFLTQELI